MGGSRSLVHSASSAEEGGKGIEEMVAGVINYVGVDRGWGFSS